MDELDDHSLPEKQAFYPGQPQIDAYGNGGFRFADMSHQGSLLFMPSGVYGWSVTSMRELDMEKFAKVLDEKDKIKFLLLGTGETQVFPDLSVRKAFIKMGVGLEIMDTGAACRTYNICLEEKRPLAAALISADPQYNWK